MSTAFRTAALTGELRVPQGIPARLPALGLTRGTMYAPPPNDDAAALQMISSRTRHRRNGTIFNDGDEALKTFKVISGVIRLCKHANDGRRQVIGFRLPGDFFGLMQAGEYSCSAEAVNDVVLDAYSQRRLNQMMSDRRGIGRRFTELLMKQLSELQAHLVLLGRQNAMERVAGFLLNLVARADAGEGEIFDVPMGQRDIADHLGLAVETICRAFCELKRDGVIDPVSTHEFRLRNAGSLRMRAAGAA